MEKIKVTSEEYAKQREHWKALVNCVFRAEYALDEKHKEKLRQTKGKSQKEIDKACDEYVSAVVDEILGFTFEVE